MLLLHNVNITLTIFTTWVDWSQLVPKVEAWPLQALFCMNPCVVVVAVVVVWVDIGWCWSNGGGGGMQDGLNEFLTNWFLGEENEWPALGEVAIALWSEVDMLENMVSASGKLGGVAGVFAGVISCYGKRDTILRKLQSNFLLDNKLTENPWPFFGIAASWK